LKGKEVMKPEWISRTISIIDWRKTKFLGGNHV